MNKDELAKYKKEIVFEVIELIRSDARHLAKLNKCLEAGIYLHIVENLLEWYSYGE